MKTCWANALASRRLLVCAEAETLAVALTDGVLRGTTEKAPPLVKTAKANLPAGKRPFADPFCWSAFVLVGDPN